MIGNIISFSLGTMFGVVVMCCLAVAKDEKDNYDDSSKINR